VVPDIKIERGKVVCNYGDPITTDVRWATVPRKKYFGLPDSTHARTSVHVDLVVNRTVEGLPRKLHLWTVQVSIG